MSGFTVAEVMVVVCIIGVIAAATIGIQKLRTDYTNKFMYYAAVKNLKEVVAELIAVGSTTTNLPNNYPPPVTSVKVHLNIVHFPDFNWHPIEYWLAIWRAKADDYYYYCSTAEDIANPANDCNNRNITMQDTYTDYYNASTEPVNDAYDSTSPPDYTKELYPPTPCPNTQAGYTNCTIPNDDYYTYAKVTSVENNAGPLVVIDGAPSTSTSKALASTGVALCNAIAEKMNTLGAQDCTQTGTATANLTTTNAMRWFNFGANPLYGENDAITSPSDPLYDNTPENDVYTIYIDIDGANKGKNLVDSDILKFYITRSGNIFPAKSPGGDDKIPGADNQKYLPASVGYTEGGTYTTVLNSTSYLNAVCNADGGTNKIVPQILNTKYAYCTGATITPAAYATCGTKSCRIKLAMPGF